MAVTGMKIKYTTKFTSFTKRKPRIKEIKIFDR